MLDKQRLTDADLDRTTDGLLVHKPADPDELVSHEVVEGRTVVRDSAEAKWKLKFSAAIPGPADFIRADLLPTGDNAARDQR